MPRSQVLRHSVKISEPLQALLLVASSGGASITTSRLLPGAVALGCCFFGPRRKKECLTFGAPPEARPPARHLPAGQASFHSSLTPVATRRGVKLSTRAPCVGEKRRGPPAAWLANWAHHTTGGPVLTRRFERALAFSLCLP